MHRSSCTTVRPVGVKEDLQLQSLRDSAVTRSPCVAEVRALLEAAPAPRHPVVGLRTCPWASESSWATTESGIEFGRKHVSVSIDASSLSQ